MVEQELAHLANRNVLLDLGGTPFCTRLSMSACKADNSVIASVGLVLHAV